MDLFSLQEAEAREGFEPGADTSAMPLAARMRPRTLDEVAGQKHLLAPGKLLRRAIETDRFTSLIFYGPPGCGKTTLAAVIARTTNAHFMMLNGVESNVADIREKIAQAQMRMSMHGRKTVLFVDELHRFNKAQQDVLLPHLEKGTVRFIGATTENPYFAINSPLLSRSQVFPLEPVPEEKTYTFPPVNLLEEPKAACGGNTQKELRANADLLVDTLRSFGVETRIVDISRGPAVTRYELQPSAGVKISRITNLADDIALNLAAGGVRIEAPIPNKAAIGIEVPNKDIAAVPIREIIDSTEFTGAKSRLSVALGKDISGRICLADLAKMPHLLIAGATGSGKSVCINSIIISLLYKASPEEVKLLMIDPKVVELGGYNGIPHLLVPVVTDPKKAAGALCWAVGEMLNRYKLFAATGTRDLEGYNRLAAEREELHPMPQIVIIIDELADLMMAAPKDVEDYICRLAQMARAAGMHLVIATQRPSVDVITGLIKANIPSRIAFAVSSQIDSRTILDSGGAEKLLGNGDMLFLPVGASKPVRVQGTFVTDEEIGAVLSFIKSTSSAQYDEEMIAEMERRAVAEKGSKKGSDDDGDAGGALDAMFEQAVECVIDAGQASTSLLQRRCKLGYARAARIMDQMEQEKIIGPYEGAKPRAVLVTKAEWEERKLNGQYDG